MTLDEFTPEILRLYRGFRAENDLTPERLNALYGGMSHYPVAAVRDAVTAALRDPKLPWFDKLHELVDREAEADRKAENRRFDDDAKRFLSRGWEPRGEQSESAKTWAKAHHEAIVLMIEGDVDAANKILERIGSPARAPETARLPRA